jgi:hypothetical protein
MKEAILYLRETKCDKLDHLRLLQLKTKYELMHYLYEQRCPHYNKIAKMLAENKLTIDDFLANYQR